MFALIRARLHSWSCGGDHRHVSRQSVVSSTRHTELMMMMHAHTSGKITIFERDRINFTQLNLIPFYAKLLLACIVVVLNSTHVVWDVLNVLSGVVAGCCWGRFVQTLAEASISELHTHNAETEDDGCTWAEVDIKNNFEVRRLLKLNPISTLDRTYLILT